MKRILFLFVAVVATGQIEFSYAQTQVKLTLRDGSSFSGSTSLNTIPLVTDYGKLDIPAKNVSSIEMGITEDPSTKEKVVSLVKQLANSDESMRKNAYEELIKMDISAIPTIQNFIYSEKYEASSQLDYTAEQALSELLALYNVKDNFNNKDVVSIDYLYTVGGRYDFKKLDIKTDYGTLSIAKSKIERIEIIYVNTGDPSPERVFKLFGNKHISSNVAGGWMNTGIMVKGGQKFSINASGEITFASLSNAKYKPDGTVSGTPAIDDYGYETSATSYPSYGNVVYKIGENGTPTKAGSSCKVAAAGSGILYLSVYETVFNPANAGSYSVKVVLK